LHTQSGFHYRTRIPRFGRSLAYHFPSCDAFCSASGNEIYRLNLDQGRFLNPLILTDDDEGGKILGVNILDINPAHQLLALGVEGNGTVQFWDLRSRSSVGVLRLPKSRLLPSSSGLSNALPGVEVGVPQTGLSVTAIASRADGLSYAIGTSTGHTLLYDIRSVRPFALKEQGYGAPVKNLLWIEGGGRMTGDGMVLSADKKVIKIWDRHSVGFFCVRIGDLLIAISTFFFHAYSLRQILRRLHRLLI
jgi:ribosome biogenesis protein ENP2